MNKLRECPFCGGEADTMEVVMGGWCVICSCGCRLDSFDTEEEAINAWNKRTMPNECQCPQCAFYSETDGCMESLCDE